MQNQHKENFKSPRALYRAKPFWAWNGKLDKDELLRQIDIAKEMGFGGVFMHSRTGLQTEYLGEEWFDLINACADHGKETGMESWLYDEDRWPSGTAGGEVTKDPKNRMKLIHMIKHKEEINKDSFISDLGMFEIVLKDELLVSYRRINSEDDATVGEVVIFVEEEMACSSFYNGYTYADTMNKETTEEYLQSTHQKYVDKCGERIGQSIAGIFTDEPHRGGLMTSFGQGIEGGEFCIPYTSTLPKIVKEKYGYDFLDRLPEIFFCTTDDHISPIKWEYVETLQQLFIENYAKPIHEYCKKHNLLLTGHILHENSLTTQTALSGSMMRYYEYLDVPGIDYLGSEENCFWIAKQLQSSARQNGQKMLLSELYGCTGWQRTFTDYKKIGDWQALYGINLRCPHLSWYTMEGQAKRDYPASIFHQATWWKEYAYVEDYYARIGEFTSVGKAVCDVLVINPVESVWAQVYSGWCSGLGAKDERIKALEKQYAETFFMLQENHIDFDYGDEGILAEKAAVDGDKICVGQATYRTVIVSGMTTIRSDTIKLLRQFAENGGKVIVLGEVPKYENCLKKAWDVKSVVIENNATELSKAVKNETVHITYDNGNEIGDILCQMKEENGTKYLMLINRAEEQRKANIEISAVGTVTQFNPENGDCVAVESDQKDGCLCITVDIEPLECLLYTFGEKFTDEQDEIAVKATEYGIITTSGEYILDEDNVCVLDFAKVSINGGINTEEKEILKADRYVREQFGLPYRGGEMLQPWFVGQKELISKGKVKLAFEFFIEVLPSEKVKLVLERPDVMSEIKCNDSTLTYQKNDFYWVDICYKMIEIPTKMLCIGANTIEISLDYTENTNLEAMFLLGNFGVKLDGDKKTLAKMPSKLKLGDIVPQGLPFYSGKITYICELADSEKTTIKFKNLGTACIKVDGNGQAKITAFPPYTADLSDFIENGKVKITAVLTRRNTFGPLHQVPKFNYTCGPDSFETEGENFSSEYGLLPNGLMCDS